jgi:hypothetical protein
MMLASGCALFPPAKTAAVPTTNLYVVIASRTPFYRYGPSQPSGPDFSLSAGQPLKLIRRDFGFSQVETDAGKLGFVSTDDIGPAPPPAPQLPPSRARARVTPRDATLPPADFTQPNDMALPANSPPPTFRY